VKEKEKGFFIKIISLLFLFLALFFIQQSFHFNNEAYSELSPNETNTLIINKESNYQGCIHIRIGLDDKVLIPKLGLLTLYNVSSIVFKCQDLYINVSVNGSYMLNITSKFIVLAPQNSRVLVNEIACEDSYGNKGYYLALKSNVLSNKNASLKAIVYQNNSFYAIPQSLLKYSLNNHTVTIPPGKCASPPTQILYNNATVIFSYNYNSVRLLLIYLISHSSYTKTMSGREASTLSSSVFETSLPPYSSSPLSQTSPILSGSQKIYLLLILLGIVMLLASFKRKR
jgi:hypothetical protein